MSVKVKEYQQFVRKILLVDQTEMVELLLRYNRDALTIHHLEEGDALTWHFGRVREPRAEFEKKHHELCCDHGEAVDGIMNAKCVEDKKHWEERLQHVKTDLAKMDGAKWGDRKIYQWLLIPHWYATHLITENEPVIKFHSCSWLGVEYNLTKYYTLEDMLMKHFKHFTKKEDRF